LKNTTNPLPPKFMQSRLKPKICCANPYMKSKEELQNPAILSLQKTHILNLKDNNSGLI
jgi:hypothetical protein